MKIKLLLFYIAYTAFGFNTHGQSPGSVDVAYGTNGKATATNGQEYDVARGMALQKDGKTIVVGYTLADFMLTRFTTRGTPDTTFGSNGVVVTDIDNNSVEQANAVIVQADGKILVTGNTLDNTKRNFALLRYLSNGTLDNSFSTDGKVITVLSTGQDEPMAIALQPDGKILLAGTSEGRFAVVRYKQNGMPDSSFSSDGIQTTFIDNGQAVARSVHVLKSGKILLVGYIDYNAQADCVMTQYLANGNLDSTFGTNGKVIADVGGIDRMYCAAVQADERIVVAGVVQTSTFLFGLARFTKTGTLDTSFSTDGKLTVSFGNNHSSKATAIALQPDGKILVTGSDYFSGYDIALLRLDSKGVPDAGFGSGGKVLTNFGPANIDEGAGIALLPDGKIMVGGVSDGDFIAVRYLSGLNLSTKTVLKENAAALYPNPATTHTQLVFTLATASPVSINIADVQGRIICTPADNITYTGGEHTETITLPVSMPPGIYWLQITTSQEIRWVKFMKY